ncbi:MAG: hypothetical protein PHW15_02235 [Patescibacteria group bacterium]|jgi:cellulose biosynthesis protein BcsQ|nr:hypothetical protein [Patescibacteria group bacterium]MDD5173100.1 hypothetical protein [Patescibacteria group bacterium]
MFKEKRAIEDEKYKKLNEEFEQNSEELADLLKEIHDKIISSEINSREELIAAYEEKMNEMISRFSDPDHERVKSYFKRYNEILEKFDEYREKEGNI